jgi:hypothetical protein
VIKHERRPTRGPAMSLFRLAGSVVALAIGCAGPDETKSSEDTETFVDAGPMGGPAPWLDAGPGSDAATSDAATSPGSQPGPPPVRDAGAPPSQPGEEMGLPCEISTILTTHCARCHGEQLSFGAPFPLVTLEDLHAPAVSDPSRKIFELLVGRMTDPRLTMPPAPAEPATEAEIETIRAWVERGAPAEKTCGADAPPPPEVPDAGMPPPNPECDHVFELRAHGVGLPGDDSPYQVPPLGDLYVNFMFKVPWTGSVHGLEFHPIVDDERVLHHMLLYSAPIGAALDGTIIPGIGTHPGESLIAGWAPGGDPMIMPEGVGLEMPPGPTGRFIMEMHYNNMAGFMDARDRSGFRVCATSAKRPQTAASHLLGTEVIVIAGPGEFTATGMCHPYLNLSGLLNREPIHIISSTPHLHRRGRNLRTEIHRADGQVEVLIDEPFNFDNQITHDTPAIINPGDWLKTVCTYENERGIAGFGVRTDDEMCQNYVLAYPVGGMDTGGSLIFEAHACML